MDASLTVAIGVLSLFKATTLTVRSDVAMQCDNILAEAGQTIVVRHPISCPKSAHWTISIPGRITRTYRGILSVVASNGFLTPVIRMDVEAAVVAAAASEMPATAPIEALKAMAVLARSYYRSAGKRHTHYDFCDTTHCQFHRDKPPADHPASHATAETRGIVSSYRGLGFPPLYSAECGGRTLSAAEVGMGAGDYPYVSVECRSCRRKAAGWTRRLPPETMGSLTNGRSEQTRLRIAREHGWSSIPGNNYRTTLEQDVIRLDGRGSGHGVGVCQRGAIALAAEGATFRDILRHYLPGVLLQ